LRIRRVTRHMGTISVSGVRYYGYRHYSPGIGRWLNRDPVEDSEDVYGFVGNETASNYDVWGLSSRWTGSLGTADELFDAGCCRVFTMKVESAHLAYDTLNHFLRSAFWRGGVKQKPEHAWIQIRDVFGTDREGGHTGENREAATYPDGRIVTREFGTFDKGVRTLLNNHRRHRRAIARQQAITPEADPRNPVRWLQFTYADGEWHNLSGLIEPHFPNHECSWCLDSYPVGFAAVADEMSRLARHPEDVMPYGPTVQNCAIKAAKVALLAGVAVDPFAPEWHVDRVMPHPVLPFARFHWWSDGGRGYDRLQFGLASKVADELHSVPSVRGVTACKAE